MQGGRLHADTCLEPMRARSLLSSVLAVNGALFALTAFVAAMVARERLDGATSTQGLLLIALGVAAAVLLDSILLRRRLTPIERLAALMDEVDLHRPRTVRARTSRRQPREVAALSRGFNRMLD